MNISVIICSWKAPLWLDEALASIYKQKEGVSFESVVVNNGFSADRANALKASFPGLVIVDEKTPGLAHARRAGFRAAKGDYFACLDDDNLVGPGFLAALEALVLSHPKLGVICPVVLPLWERTPPLWLQEFGVTCLSYTARAVPSESGQRREQIWRNPNFNGWPWPPGGGMIIHRSIAQDYLRLEGGRRLGLGRVGNSLGGSEDQDIYCRVAALGRDAAYSEKLIVFHQIPACRTRMSYLWRLSFRMAQDWATLERFWRQENHPFASNTLKSHARAMIRLPLRCALGRITPQRCSLEWVRHAGFVWGWTKDSLSHLGQGLQSPAPAIAKKT